MTHPTLRRTRRGPHLAALLLGAATLALALPRAAAAEALIFETPEAAVSALIATLEAADRDELVAIFGPESEDVILTGNDAEDREVWSEFLGNQRAMSRIVVDGATATLEVGRTLWPFPIPLVGTEAGWRFDAEAGREEVLLRRIGQNELDVIDLMGGYVRAQADYRASDPDDDGLRTFAAGILSTPGTRDGLYWPPEPGAPESPVGDFMARASADGYSVGEEDLEADPYLGYYYRVLTRQGPEAPGGAFDYMVGGHMLAGHALLAYPAAYGETGVMSFMVGENGVIYEADLGEETLEVAGAIESYDPGEAWAPVEAE
ncbi:MAG TPA: DUF2950 domain-containing protein [Amaricoccus sp.]|uniref:DUF2950 domain-containing protein n=1 Tax=Amaricoccus sp. TaxID=1872485 RepID=UPI002C731BC6|nr:DUF2950 domain-containing protein [Amaricoccus sp.]HMQ92881.1 DUF2950 domain-containing protein [Amaricoccus sp.]HMR52407.1 DUF2950 domain-containing protein [Amaricoccus sp.]HMR59207.1 DUF2950 domain-containing protein [Amaricoccus sp.]HMT99328.1 DUF2950 domain-containing protein [Amaricoccus sp.]